MNTSNNPDDLAIPLPRSLRILCAEDNTHVRDSLACLFTASKLNVVFAHDGQHALDLLAAQPDAFDLIITDHEMPRLGGLAFVRCLRERSFPGHIIVFSSSLHPNDRQAYHALHVRDLVSKPDHSHDLLKLIEQLNYKLRHPSPDSSSTSPPSPSNA